MRHLFLCALLAGCASAPPKDFLRDLATPAAERCAEARAIAADLDTADAYALAVVACAG